MGPIKYVSVILRCLFETFFGQINTYLAGDAHIYKYFYRHELQKTGPPSKNVSETVKTIPHSLLTTVNKDSGQAAPARTAEQENV
jgi:hypothetical protein